MDKIKINKERETKSDYELITLYSIKFGLYIAKNTIPAGGDKFYHKEYLIKGIKYKKLYTSKQLFKRFMKEEFKK